MPALSQAAADLWNNVSNVVLVIGAIAVMGGTWGAFWTGSMKEFYSNERIAANEVRTAAANEKAAGANERAAGLERQAAEVRERAAKLEADLEVTRSALLAVQDQAARLDRSIAYRIIDRNRFLNATRDKPHGSVIIEYVSGDRETLSVATQLNLLLREAGWSVLSNSLIDQTKIVAMQAQLPLFFGTTPDETSHLLVENATDIYIVSQSETNIPANILLVALRDAGMLANYIWNSGFPADEVTVMIGSRLN